VLEIEITPQMVEAGASVLRFAGLSFRMGGEAPLKRCFSKLSHFQILFVEGN